MVRLVERGLLVGALGLCAVLAWESRAHRAVRRELAEMRMFPVVSHMVPTERMPTLAGDTVVLGATAAGRAQVVFALTTSCPYCLASLPEWTRTAAQVRSAFGDAVDVYWLSLSDPDSTRAYAAAHGLPASSVLLRPHAKMAPTYRIKGGPLVLVYDAAGRLAYRRPYTMVTTASGDSVVAAVGAVLTATGPRASAAVE
jgi:hypothetical protein